MDVPAADLACGCSAPTHRCLMWLAASAGGSCCASQPTGSRRRCGLHKVSHLGSGSVTHDVLQQLHRTPVAPPCHCWVAHRWPAVPLANPVVAVCCYSHPAAWCCHTAHPVLLLPLHHCRRLTSGSRRLWTTLCRCMPRPEASKAERQAEAKRLRPSACRGVRWLLRRAAARWWSAADKRLEGCTQLGSLAGIRPGGSSGLWTPHALQAGGRLLALAALPSSGAHLKLCAACVFSVCAAFQMLRGCCSVTCSCAWGRRRQGELRGFERAHCRSSSHAVGPLLGLHCCCPA